MLHVPGLIMCLEDAFYLNSPGVVVSMVVRRGPHGLSEEDYAKVSDYLWRYVCLHGCMQVHGHAFL